MILTYEAMDAEGRRTHDAVEAPNSKEAVELLLRRRGLFVTRIEQSAEPKAKTATSGAHGDRSRLPLKKSWRCSRGRWPCCCMPAAELCRLFPRLLAR